MERPVTPRQPAVTPLVTEVLRQRKRELEDLDWADTTSPAAAQRRRNLQFEIRRLQTMHRNGEIYDPAH